MNVGELKELLRRLPDDMEIVKQTSVHTMVRAYNIGTVKLIPKKDNVLIPRKTKLIPGNEWYVPIHSKYRPEIKRTTFLYIG